MTGGVWVVEYMGNHIKQLAAFENRQKATKYYEQERKDKYYVGRVLRVKFYQFGVPFES